MDDGGFGDGLSISTMDSSTGAAEEDQVAADSAPAVVERVVAAVAATSSPAAAAGPLSARRHVQVSVEPPSRTASSAALPPSTSTPCEKRPADEEGIATETLATHAVALPPVRRSVDSQRAEQSVGALLSIDAQELRRPSVLSMVSDSSSAMPRSTGLRSPVASQWRRSDTANAVAFSPVTAPQPASSPDAIVAALTAQRRLTQSRALAPASDLFDFAQSPPPPGETPSRTHSFSADEVLVRTSIVSDQQQQPSQKLSITQASHADEAVSIPNYMTRRRSTVATIGSGSGGGGSVAGTATNPAAAGSGCGTALSTSKTKANLIRGTTFASNLKSKSIDSWQWDIFSNPPEENIFIALNMFEDYGILKMLNINGDQFLGFMRDVRAGYHPNPYHNFDHGFDVMQTCYTFLKGMHAGEVLTNMDVMVLMLSAVAHDLDHPGLTNDFLVKAKDPLARIYNDRSVLENHHTAMLFEVIERHGLFANLTDADYKLARRKIVDAILSTDMARHFTLCSDMKTFIVDNDLEDVTKNRRQLQLSDESRSFLVNILLHNADISNPAKPWHLSKRWSDSVLEEFFRQGELERSLHMPVSQNMDPETTDQAVMSCNFIDFIIEPSYATLKSIFPLTTECYENLRKNRARWDELKKNNKQLRIEAQKRHRDKKRVMNAGGSHSGLGSTTIRLVGANDPSSKADLGAASPISASKLLQASAQQNNNNSTSGDHGTVVDDNHAIELHTLNHDSSDANQQRPKPDDDDIINLSNQSDALNNDDGIANDGIENHDDDDEVSALPPNGRRRNDHRRLSVDAGSVDVPTEFSRPNRRWFQPSIKGRRLRGGTKSRTSGDNIGSISGSRHADDDADFDDDDFDEISTKSIATTYGDTPTLTWQESLAEHLEGPWRRGGMIVLTILALYTRDVFVIASGRSADTAWGAILLVVIALFTVDMVLHSLASKQKYFGSFWFFVDLLGTCALIGDLPWLFNDHYMFIDLQVVRAGGIALAGTIAASWANKAYRTLRALHCLDCCFSKGPHVRKQRLSAAALGNLAAMSSGGAAASGSAGAVLGSGAGNGAGVGSSYGNLKDNIVMDMFDFDEDVDPESARQAMIAFTGGEHGGGAPPTVHRRSQLMSVELPKNVAPSLTGLAPTEVLTSRASPKIHAPTLATKISDEPESSAFDRLLSADSDDFQRSLRDLMPKTRTGDWVLELMSRRVVIFVAILAVVFPLFLYPYYEQTSASRVQALEILSLLPATIATTSATQYAASASDLIDVFINGTGGVPFSGTIDVSELRDFEVLSYAWPSTANTLSWSRFSARDKMRREAGLSIGLTTSLIVFMFVAARVLRFDVRATCVKPFERALAIVTECSSIRFVGIEAGKRAVAMLEASARTLPTPEAAGRESDTMVEGIERMSTLVTIGVGLGAGGRVLSSAVDSKGQFVPTAQGTQINAILGQFRMHQCDALASTLRGKVMVLINSVSRLVHESCLSTGGYPITAGFNTSVVWPGDESLRRESRFPESRFSTASHFNNSASLRSVQSVAPRADGRVHAGDLNALAGRPRPVNLADQSIEACSLVIEELDLAAEGRTSQWFGKEHMGVVRLMRRQHDGFSVRGCFMLHTGWAIEGCAGSRVKASAAYVGPHALAVNVLAEAMAPLGASILLTADLFALLSSHYKSMCRRVDRLRISHLATPVDIYMWDPHTFEAGVDFKKAFGGMYGEIEGGYDAIKQYRSLFQQSSGAYIQGNWSKAAEILELCVHTCPNDCAAVHLLRFVEKYDRKTPSDWPGYRVVF